MISASFLRKNERQRTYQMVLIVLVTIAALTLRLFKLGEWSFWVDEVLTVFRAQDSLHYVLAAPKVSGLLTKLSISVFGTSEWSARLAPAILGVLSIPILYLIVKRLFDQTTALLAAILLSVSSWHIYLSQNARYYSALLLFAVVAMFYFYFGLETAKRRYLILFMLFSMLAISERLFALLLLPVFLGYLALLLWMNYRTQQDVDLKRLVLFTSLPIVAYVGFELYQVLFLDQEFLFLRFIRRFVGEPNTRPRWILSQFIQENVGAPVAWAAFVGILYTWRDRSRARLLFLLGALVPLLLVMVLSVFSRTFTRYLLIALPGWLVLAAVGIRELYLKAREGHLRAWAWALILVALVALSPVTSDFWFYLSSAPAILSIVVGIPLAGMFLFGLVRSSSDQLMKGRAPDSTHVTGSLLVGSTAWPLVVLFIFLLYSVVQLDLYYRYQHGYRDDMKGLLLIYEQEKEANDALVVHQTLRPIVRYYLGDELADDAGVVIDEAISENQHVWVVEEFGMSRQLAEGLSFTEWSNAHCSLKEDRDHFAAGKFWPSRLYLCAQSK